MRTIDGIGSWVLILMAIASLVTMIAAFQLDVIVHQDLYNYGLQFSDSWAYPYWTAIRVIFAMSWLSIIATISFQVYKTMALRKLYADNGEEEIEVSFNSEAEIVNKPKNNKPKVTKT